VDSRYLLVLKDVQNPEKIFKYPLDGKVTLGRNVDKVNIAIDYNRTVSGQHCQIYTRNNRFYINDLNSANKTYVNGRVITGETEITPGTKIRLGEVEFSVEMFPI
jgi:pSer/pThr/pTyr-binding forkhead associated (FHA) protein